MTARRWPHVRASLIALAIVLGMVEGCPLPPTRYVKPWQEPIVSVVRPIQHAVLVPVRWIPRHLRFSQRWALMQGARRDRFRFTVEGRTADGSWTLLYRANDADHDAFANILETHHVWGAWNPTKHMMAQYGAFLRWFTQHALAARPDLSAIRTSQEKVIIEHGELRGTGEYINVTSHARARRASGR